MNKRIFRTMGLLIALTVLFFALLWGFAYSGQYGEQIKNHLRSIRISVIDEAGEVLYDTMADTAELENHSDRPEIISALLRGTGEAERYSDTLNETTYYYAIKLNDGNVLRLALATSSLSELLRTFVPVVLICLAISAILAFIIARRLTRRIVAPINDIDLDAPALTDYDELAPFLRKIETQKKELVERVNEIESRSATINAITENMKEGLLLLDKDGRVLLANGSVNGILNIKDTVGRSAIEVCRAPEFLQKVKDCIKGNTAEIVLKIQERYYNTFFSPVSENGSINGAVVLFIDITDRSAAEAQRKEFSANVSHELKTPLTTIAGLSEMIANGTAKDAELRPFAGKIEKQASRLIDIVNDIIKLSEFDEGNIPKDFARLDLHDLAETVIMGLREKAEQRGVTMELRGDAHLYIAANARMMDEMLYNLIDNAITYNREGGNVTVTLAEGMGQMRISVADTGIGIEREHLGRIFERFYRADKSRSKKTGGTGLGLSIVKHVAEFHGGRVAVDSAEGKGSYFTVTLPSEREAE